MNELQNIYEKCMEIYEGCENIKQEKGIHEDAKDLARMVRKDLKSVFQDLNELMKNETQS